MKWDRTALTEVVSRQFMVACITVLMASWGIVAWAAGQHLGTITSPFSDAFTFVLSSALLIGSLGVTVSVFAATVGWLPQGWLAGYATILMHPFHRHAVVVLYVTPLLAYLACLLGAPSMLAIDSAWTPLAAVAAAMPSAVLCSFHAWLLAPLARGRRPVMPAAAPATVDALSVTSQRSKRVTVRLLTGSSGTP